MEKISKDNLYSLIFFAFIIEALITYTNTILVKHNLCWEIITSLIISILISIAYKIDLISYFDFKTKIPFLGNIITGILLSRGSNFIFDFLKSITQKG